MVQATTPTPRERGRVTRPLDLQDVTSLGETAGPRSGEMRAVVVSLHSVPAARALGGDPEWAEANAETNAVSDTPVPPAAPEEIAPPRPVSPRTRLDFGLDAAKDAGKVVGAAAFAVAAVTGLVGLLDTAAELLPDRPQRVEPGHLFTFGERLAVQGDAEVTMREAAGRTAIDLTSGHLRTQALPGADGALEITAGETTITSEGGGVAVERLGDLLTVTATDGAVTVSGGGRRVTVPPGDTWSAEEPAHPDCEQPTAQQALPPTWAPPAGAPPADMLGFAQQGLQPPATDANGGAGSGAGGSPSAGAGSGDGAAAAGGRGGAGGGSASAAGTPGGGAAARGRQAALQGAQQKTSGDGVQVGAEEMSAAQRRLAVNGEGATPADRSAAWSPPPPASGDLRTCPVGPDVPTPDDALAMAAPSPSAAGPGAVPPHQPSSAPAAAGPPIPEGPLFPIGWDNIVGDRPPPGSSGASPSGSPSGGSPSSAPGGQGGQGGQRAPSGQPGASAAPPPSDGQSPPAASPPGGGPQSQSPQTQAPQAQAPQAQAPQAQAPQDQGPSDQSPNNPASGPDGESSSPGLQSASPQSASPQSASPQSASPQGSVPGAQTAQPSASPSQAPDDQSPSAQNPDSQAGPQNQNPSPQSAAPHAQAPQNNNASPDPIAAAIAHLRLDPSLPSCELEPDE